MVPWMIGIFFFSFFLFPRFSIGLGPDRLRFGFFLPLNCASKNRYLAGRSSLFFFFSFLCGPHPDKAPFRLLCLRQPVRPIYFPFSLYQEGDEQNVVAGGVSSPFPFFLPGAVDSIFSGAPAFPLFFPLLQVDRRTACLPLTRYLPVFFPPPLGEIYTILKRRPSQPFLLPFPSPSIAQRARLFFAPHSVQNRRDKAVTLAASPSVQCGL